MPNPALLPAGVWTTIAIQQRDPSDGKLLEWSPISGAPIDIATARETQAAGQIIMANRHFDHHVELVVRPAA